MSTGLIFVCDACFLGNEELTLGFEHDVKPCGACGKARSARRCLWRVRYEALKSDPSAKAQAEEFLAS